MNKNFQRIDIEKEIQEIKNVEKKLTNDEIRSKLLDLFASISTNKEIGAEDLYLTLSMPEAMARVFLKTTKRRLFLLKLLKKHSLSPDVCRKILSLEKDFLSTIISLNLDKAIIADAREIRNSFIRDCKKSDAKLSTALNSANLKTKINLTLEALDICWFGSIESWRGGRILLKLISGETYGKTFSHLRKEVLENQKRKEFLKNQKQKALA